MSHVFILLYRYYEGGISSVYLWETDSPEGFAACFLIKKGKCAFYPDI